MSEYTRQKVVTVVECYFMLLIFLFFNMSNNSLYFKCHGFVNDRYFWVSIIVPIIFHFCFLSWFWSSAFGKQWKNLKMSIVWKQTCNDKRSTSSWFTHSGSNKSKAIIHWEPFMNFGFWLIFYLCWFMWHSEKILWNVHY